LSAKKCCEWRALELECRLAHLLLSQQKQSRSGINKSTSRWLTALSGTETHCLQKTRIAFRRTLEICRPFFVFISKKPQVRQRYCQEKDRLSTEIHIWVSLAALSDENAICYALMPCNVNCMSRIIDNLGIT
jgi:hypothetical protein